MARRLGERPSRTRQGVKHPLRSRVSGTASGSSTRRHPPIEGARDEPRRRRCRPGDPRSRFYDEGRFGRLFPTLPRFAADTPLIRDALIELGAAGGPMDAGDDLSDPVTLITDPAKSANNPNNPTMTAGFTFLGQFIDHDMTFDPTSSLARRQDPESIRNFRIPALDLDSVYGGGPNASSHLYDQSIDGGRTTFLTEEIPGSVIGSIDSGTRHDLPRNSQLVALAGDPRNDENLVVSQLHLALLRFHNTVVEDIKDELGPGFTVDEIFAEAQRTVRWHYQWLVLHEFLPVTVGQGTVDDVLANGLKHYKWRNEPFIPVEFSVAAYRFGHSQISGLRCAGPADPSPTAHRRCAARSAGCDRDPARREHQQPARRSGRGSNWVALTSSHTVRDLGAPGDRCHLSNVRHLGCPRQRFPALDERVTCLWLRPTPRRTLVSAICTLVAPRREHAMGDLPSAWTGRPAAACSCGRAAPPETRSPVARLKAGSPWR